MNCLSQLLIIWEWELFRQFDVVYGLITGYYTLPQAARIHEYLSQSEQNIESKRTMR